MMRIDSHTGLLADAEYCPSPNCDQRPAGMVPELLVVHSISLPPGEYGSRHIRHFFQNTLDWTVHSYFQEIKHLRVSAHVLIDRQGNVVQFVPFHKRAWHAGVSQFQERDRCNDFSVGIELEGTDDSAFETAQYWKLAQCIHALRTTYASMYGCPLVGHSDIAPGRKTDPGTGFDWDRLMQLLARLEHKQV